MRQFSIGEKVKHGDKTGSIAACDLPAPEDEKEKRDQHFYLVNYDDDSGGGEAKVAEGDLDPC